MPANVTLFWCQDREWRYNPDREMKGDCTRSREARAKPGAKQCRHITINLPSQWCSEVHGPRTLLRERVHTSFTLLLITLGEGVRRMHFCNFGGSWWKLITTRWISSYWQILEWLSTSEVSEWGMLFGWSRRWIPCSFIDIKCEQRNGKG